MLESSGGLTPPAAAVAALLGQGGVYPPPQQQQQTISAQGGFTPPTAVAVAGEVNHPPQTLRNMLEDALAESLAMTTSMQEGSVKQHWLDIVMQANRRNESFSSALHARCLFFKAFMQDKNAPFSPPYLI